MDITTSEPMSIAPLTDQHMAQAVALSASVSWPHQAQDWALLIRLSRGLGAFRGAELVGAALITPFAPEVSTLGMVAVRPDHQGQGIAKRLVGPLLPDAGTCRLVATDEGRGLYQSFGFRETGQVLQYRAFISQTLPVDGDVSQADRDDRAELARITALENAAFGGNRGQLMDWLCQHGTLLVARDAKGDVIGYVAIRPMADMHVIGPVAAPDPGTAECLVAAACNRLQGQTARLDTVAGSGLSPWLEATGFQKKGHGTIMMRGDGPAPPARFAVFSQAVF